MKTNYKQLLTQRKTIVDQIPSNYQIQNIVEARLFWEQKKKDLQIINADSKSKVNNRLLFLAAPDFNYNNERVSMGFDLKIVSKIYPNSQFQYFVEEILFKEQLFQIINDAMKNTFEHLIIIFISHGSYDSLRISSLSSFDMSKIDLFGDIYSMPKVDNDVFKRELFELISQKPHNLKIDFISVSCHSGAFLGTKLPPNVRTIGACSIDEDAFFYSEGPSFFFWEWLQKKVLPSKPFTTIATNQNGEEVIIIQSPTILNSED